MNLLLTNASTEGGRAAISPDFTNANSGRMGRIPPTMPQPQMYYWSSVWQDGEREALAEFDAGEFVRFDSDDPEDVARWLDDPDTE